MTIALTWTTYLDAIARLAVVAVDDVNFVALAPQMINYAELRIQRDLDFLHSIEGITGPLTVVGGRTLEIGIEGFITLQEIHVLLPAGIVDSNTAIRRPLVPATKEFIATVYSPPAATGVPKYFAMFDQGTVLLGPRPDAAYSTRLIGTVRLPSLYTLPTPPPLATSFISTYLPDILIMASMIWISGYQRNFGRQSDDPQQAMSYEAQYMTLLKGAMVEEARKKFQSSAWSSMTPAPVASPSRQVAG